jgi:hypothetical protein
MTEAVIEAGGAIVGGGPAQLVFFGLAPKLGINSPVVAA